MVSLFFTILFLLRMHFLLPGFVPDQSVLAVKSMSLDNRYPVKSVNDVFKSNILLTLAYMKQHGAVPTIDTKTVDKPLHYAITLRNGEAFAFHDNILPAYQSKVVATTNAHFNSQEGFKSDGYLIGDGVCHLASLIAFAARSAGLGVVSPTSHDFANIPDVPKQYGVSIYASPVRSVNSEQQNLYITNTFSENVTIVLDYQNSILKVTILKQTS